MEMKNDIGGKWLMNFGFLARYQRIALTIEVQ